MVIKWRRWIESPFWNRRPLVAQVLGLDPDSRRHHPICFSQILYIQQNWIYYLHGMAAIFCSGFIPCGWNYSLDFIVTMESPEGPLWAFIHPHVIPNLNEDILYEDTVSFFMYFDGQSASINFHCTNTKPLRHISKYLFYESYRFWMTQRCQYMNLFFCVSKKNPQCWLY